MLEPLHPGWHPTSPVWEFLDPPLGSYDILNGDVKPHNFNVVYWKPNNHCQNLLENVTADANIETDHNIRKALDFE